MGVRINNLENENRVKIAEKGNFSVIEFKKDLSVAPDNCMNEYFMGQMNIRRRQVKVELDGSNRAMLQSGAMQVMSGNIRSVTGVKGAKDLFGKLAKSVVTNESAIKPEYEGEGTILLEPTYKYVILQDVSEWGPYGMVIEDGMFLACDGAVKHSIVSRKNISSALMGGEGLFNLCLSGNGIVALESNVPEAELVEFDLENGELKLDGNLAVCWSGSLQFTVEQSSASLIGSMVNGEGLVNVYRGTGKVLATTVAPTTSLGASTHVKEANTGVTGLMGKVLG